MRPLYLPYGISRVTSSSNDLASMGCLSARALDGVALLLEHPDHTLAVITLHFDHAVLHRTSRAASGLELLAQLDKRSLGQRQALDHRHGLPAPALGFARNSHDAVGRRGGLRQFAHALRDRPAARRTHAPGIRGVHQAAAGRGPAFHDRNSTGSGP